MAGGGGLLPVISALEAICTAQQVARLAHNTTSTWCQRWPCQQDICAAESLLATHSQRVTCRGLEDADMRRSEVLRSQRVLVGTHAYPDSEQSDLRSGSAHRHAALCRSTSSWSRHGQAMWALVISDQTPQRCAHSLDSGYRTSGFTRLPSQVLHQCCAVGPGCVASDADPAEPSHGRFSKAPSLLQYALHAVLASVSCAVSSKLAFSSSALCWVRCSTCAASCQDAA